MDNHVLVSCPSCGRSFTSTLTPDGTLWWVDLWCTECDSEEPNQFEPLEKILNTEIILNWIDGELEAANLHSFVGLPRKIMESIACELAPYTKAVAAQAIAKAFYACI